MIKMTRIDHRLLHGQVAVAWAHALQVDCILIVNDDVAHDEFQKSLMKMAKPHGVKLIFKSIAATADAINLGKTDTYSVYVIVKTILDAQTLCELCPSIQYINLGLSEIKEHAQQLGRSIYVNEDEIAALKAMSKKGIQIVMQQTPSDRGVDVVSIL